MPGRNSNINSYRFGYNGMEKDDELKGNGNSYTTEFRQYDPRLGRWLSLDPLMAGYPEMSPYVAFNDNPVYFVDPLGLEGGPAKQEYPSHQESGHVLANGEVVPIPFSREYADEYAKKNNTVVLGMGSITVYELPEVETNPDHDIPDFVEENSAWGADAVDGEIARRGIESFAPQPPNIPESADQWEKDFANWNYKNNKEVWDKASLEEKWQSARQSLIIGGIREASQEMVKPVAELYTIQAGLGGSGLATGPALGTGTITKVAKAAEVTEAVMNSYDDIVANPLVLWGKSADEVGEALGEGWTKGAYGSDKKGWAFRKGDKIVYGHAGGGTHKGSYVGVRSSTTNQKVVSRSTYKAGQSEKAKILYVD